MYNQLSPNLYLYVLITPIILVLASLHSLHSLHAYNINIMVRDARIILMLYAVKCEERSEWCA